MQRYDILNKLKTNGLVAVVRGKTAEEAYEISKRVIKGGIKNIEVTFTTPFANLVIEKLVKEYKNNKEVLIGAGTVMDPETCRIAMISGAKFFVSPYLCEGIAYMCNRYNLPYLPGCGSVTEVNRALELGVDVVKVFPGGVLGSKFIKDVKGPMPYCNMMPSGGVSLDNMNEWVESKAFAIGIGSALVKNGLDEVENVTKKFVEKYLELTK